MTVLALWLPRLDHLRSLGPVSDAARRRGWRVLALCPTGGPKETAHRQREAVSAALGGVPAAPVRGAGEALEALEHVDACVAVGLVQADWVRQHVMPQSRRWGTAWVSVGYLQEELLQVVTAGPAILYEWDVATTSTPEGVDWLAEQMARLSAFGAGLVRRRLMPIGVPALDPLVGLDRAACRVKYGLPKEGRVLLFVPAANPHLMPRWRRWVFDGPLAWAAGPLGLTTYRRVGRTVWDYSRGHGAHVVIKTRAKNPDPPWLSGLGEVIGDRSWHPHTALELAVAADAYCGFASGMAIEATAAGLPQAHFFAWPPAASEHPAFLPWRKQTWLADGPWSCPGVAKGVRLDRGPGGLEAWATSAWPKRPEPERCRQALTSITGPLDGKASERVLDAIERAIR